MSSIETLNAKRDEANKLVSEIHSQSKLIEENVLKSKELLNQIIVNSKGVNKLNTSLNRIIDTTQDSIKKFSTEKDSIVKLLNQVNIFYNNKFLPLSNKINNRESGLQSKIIEVKNGQVEILKIAKLSSQQYTLVKNYADELRKKKQDLVNIDKSIRKLLSECTDKNQKVVDINKHVLALESQIKKTSTSIEKLLKTGQENEHNISILLSDSRDEFGIIQKIKEDSNNLLSEIRDIYEIAADTGLSGEFDRRRSQLKDILAIWEERIFISTLVLFIIIVLMFVGQLWIYKWDVTNHTFDINFYLRFLIASPVVYYIYFCSMQYSQTRRLHDKYSFKATLAMSIKNHTQFLTQHEKFDTTDRVDKVLDFVLDGFQKIYCEPHASDENKIRLKLLDMEMEIEKKILESIAKTSGIKK